MQRNVHNGPLAYRILIAPERIIFAQNQKIMKSKQILGIVFTIVGAIGLAVGVMSVFNKGLAFGQNPWGVAIIGGIFFLTGMGLMRTVSN